MWHSPLMIYSFIFNVFSLLLNVCLRSIISVALYSSGSWINQQFKMPDCCKCSFAHLFCLEAEQKISSRSKLSFAWSSHPATCNLHTCNSKKTQLLPDLTFVRMTIARTTFVLTTFARTTSVRMTITRTMSVQTTIAQTTVVLITLFKRRVF